MLKRKKAHTIREILYMVDRLHDKSKRLTYLLGYKSKEISKTFRKMLSTCNSFGIILIQFGHYKSGLQILQKGVDTDVCMFFEGNSKDRVWYGRVLIYSLLGYLLQRICDFQSSLKFLYDAESLLVEIKEKTQKRTFSDLTIAHSLITFIVLCKIQRLDRAEEYAEIAIAEFNAISNQEASTRLEDDTRNSLFCLLTLCGEVFRAAKTGDYEESKVNCSDVLRMLEGEENAASELLQRFAEAPSYELGLDLILSEEFQSLLFTTSCFGFIGPNTPVINKNELIRTHKFSLREAKDMLACDSDIYTTIMKESLAHVREIPRKNH